MRSTKISVQRLSLGAIVGASAPTTGLAGSFICSPTFLPTLFANITATADFQALVAATDIPGLTTGSPEHIQAVYAGFIPKFAFAIQTTVDSVDPLNHAAALLEAETPVQVIEIVGDGSNLADQVLPNRVAQFPLSGTEPLITSLGLEDKCVDGGIVAGSGVVRFVKGHRSSLVNPYEVDDVTDGLALEATGAMQAQVAGFAATGDITIAPAQEHLLQTCP